MFSNSKLKAKTNFIDISDGLIPYRSQSWQF